MKLNAVAQSPPTRDLPDLAARLEADGCDTLFFAELAHDAFLAVAAAAPGASRMALGTSIALAFPRGPTPLAYAANDLSLAAGGRFILGLGPQVRAHIERRFGQAWTDPVQRMRELVLAMRAIWECWRTGGELRFEGEVYKLSLMPPAFRPEPSPYPPPPVYLAAVGPKMAGLAGEVADGLFIHAFATPAYVREVILPAVEEGLSRSGRSRADFQLCLSVFLADAADPRGLAAAREETRAAVAFYASTPDYRRVLDQHGLGDLQPRLRQLTREGAWARLAADISDEVLDLFSIAGAPDAVGEALRTRWGGLVDQVSLPVEFWTRHRDDPAWARAAAELAATAAETG
jgi:probable F420-dependent oxidoreductase